MNERIHKTLKYWFKWAICMNRVYSFAASHFLKSQFAYTHIDEIRETENSTLRYYAEDIQPIHINMPQELLCTVHIARRRNSYRYGHKHT